jgi:hypothetical protein
MRLVPSELVVAALTSLLMVTPAYAAVSAPAPVAGLGIGAAALVAAGYRAIKRRIGR